MKALWRALPMFVRMMAGLIGEPRVPTAAKIALGAVLIYLASPVDLIPDFIPLLGWLDDALLAAILVDGILSFVDRAVVLRYWPGSPESLDKIARIAHGLAAWVPRRVKERIFSARPR